MNLLSVPIPVDLNALGMRCVADVRPQVDTDGTHTHGLSGEPVWLIDVVCHRGRRPEIITINFTTENPPDWGTNTMPAIEGVTARYEPAGFDGRSGGVVIWARHVDFNPPETHSRYAGTSGTGTMKRTLA